jgi:hypothetical protein
MSEKWQGFRTPATVQAASSRSAGIRNPQHNRTHARGKHQSISEASTEWDVTSVTRFPSIEMTL